MSASISKLNPQELWKQFAELNAIPRPSKREDRIVEFMLAFGNRLRLDTQRDEIGNVLIRKPASPGYEDRPVVVLQAHLDMVHQKNEDTPFDFDTQGIEMYIDGDWVCAKGTTLGADNGLGVAAIMAILESETIVHPPLEALFTVDEETGMSGSKALSPNWLKGKILLNLDTEEDDEIGVGCAGGRDVTGTGKYTPDPAPTGCVGVKIAVTGLKGGHSGMDIHLGLANANKVLARVLKACNREVSMSLGSFQGGSLRNAIPREATAVLAIPSSEFNSLASCIEAKHNTIMGEFEGVDPGISISLDYGTLPDTVMPAADFYRLINCLYAVPNGVAYMSAAFPGQTETSNNLATVRVTSGQIHIGCLTRSSVESRKLDLVQNLEAVFDLAGYTTKTDGDYPGWKPNPQSEILTLVKDRYQILNGSNPRILAGHGGLECGIIGAHYPGMDMISIGPTILGAHSPDERASILSTQKFWRQLTDILENIG